MHWHAFVYTGNARPPDSAARDVSQAVPPNEISMFFRKPASMRAGTFQAPVPAWEWLSVELAENPPPQTALPVDTFLEQARECLDRKADAYVGYYTAQGARFLIRALLACPRDGEHCPEPSS
jgi:hypothetical protein